MYCKHYGPLMYVFNVKLRFVLYLWFALSPQVTINQSMVRMPPLESTVDLSSLARLLLPLQLTRPPKPSLIPPLPSPQFSLAWYPLRTSVPPPLRPLPSSRGVLRPPAGTQRPPPRLS